MRKLFTLLFLVAGLFILNSCEQDEPMEQLNANIDASNISFTTDENSIDGRRIKTGQTITLSDGSSGNPDSWEWTFSDGTSTISEQDATVSWNDPVGEITITLTVTRSSDGATDTDELTVQVGPVDMLNAAVFNFEDQDVPFTAIDKWYLWTPNAGTVTTSIETSEGANGTAQSMKLVASSDYGEFQLRPHDKGPEFLVSLQSETSYIFSFYMKASESFTLSEVSILNLKNDDPKEGWYTPLCTCDAAIADPDVTTEWKMFSYEFTTDDLTTYSDNGYNDGTADNAGPFFKHFGSISGSELTVWIDEISLKIKE